MRVLAVDDDELIRDLLRIALFRAGYFEAQFAASGHAALDLIADAEVPFDCFLLDVNMPEMDGIALCSRIRAIPGHADTPIIMITRCDHRKFISDAFDAGASDYIVKPFDQAEIGIRVDLAQRRSENQRAAQQGGNPQFANINASRVTEAFALAEVPNCVDRHGFDAALLRLPSFSRFRIGVLKIVNAEAMFAESPGAAFRDRMDTVGRILADLLWEESFCLTYRGGGAIAFVLQGASDVDCRDLAVRFNDWIADTAPFAGIEPVVVVASDGPSRYIPRRDRLACLQFATDMAEDLAEQIVGEADAMARLATPKRAIA